MRSVTDLGSAPDRHARGMHDALLARQAHVRRAHGAPGAYGELHTRHETHFLYILYTINYNYNAILHIYSSYVPHIPSNDSNEICKRFSFIAPRHVAPAAGAILAADGGTPFLSSFPLPLPKPFRPFSAFSEPFSLPFRVDFPFPSSDFSLFPSRPGGVRSLGSRRTLHPRDTGLSASSQVTCFMLKSTNMTWRQVVDSSQCPWRLRPKA